MGAQARHSIRLMRLFLAAQMAARRLLVVVSTFGERDKLEAPVCGDEPLRDVAQPPGLLARLADAVSPLLETCRRPSKE
jgi:hypothetical protein